MNIEAQNQAIREALDCFDFERAQELLTAAKPSANAETWYLAALAEGHGSQREAYLRLALAQDPDHAAAKQVQTYAVEVDQPVAQAQTLSVSTQAVVETKQVAPVTSTPPNALVTTSSTNSNAFTFNETKYLYRPTWPFVVIALVAAMVGIVTNFAELGRQVNEISQLSVVYAYLIAAICAGLAAGALARARVGLLVLPAAPLPTIFIFTMTYAFSSNMNFGSDFSSPRFAMSVAAGLMSAVAVTFVLAQQSERLTAGNSLGEPHPGMRRKAAITAALVGGGMMIPLVWITPKSNSFDSDPATFWIVTLVAFGYGILGIFAGMVMRTPAGCKPTPGFWMLLCGSTIGVGMLPPALWMAAILQVRSGYIISPPVQSATFSSPVVIGWGMVAFAATFMFLGLIYLATSWQNAYPPPPLTPEQAEAAKQSQQQAKEVLGVLGLFALIFGAAYLKHSADQAQQQEALRQQRLREQEALRRQQLAQQQAQQRQQQLAQQQAQQRQQQAASSRPSAAPSQSTPQQTVAGYTPPTPDRDEIRRRQLAEAQYEADRQAAQQRAAEEAQRRAEEAQRRAEDDARRRADDEARRRAADDDYWRGAGR